MNQQNITKEQAVKRLLEYSPQIQAAKTNYSATENAIKTARGSFFPNISLTANKATSKTSTAIYGTSAATSTSYTAQIELVQPIYSGGTLWAAYDYAKVSELSAKATYNQTLQNEVFLLLENIYQYHFTKIKLESLKSFQQQQLKFLKITQRKAKRGNTKSYEARQANANYLSYIPRIQSIQMAIKPLFYKLQNLLGWNHNFNISLELEKSFKKLPKLSESYIRNSIFKKRNEYLLQTHAVEINKIQKKLNRAEHMPSLNFVATKGYQAVDTSDLFEEGSDIHTYALSLSIPLFSGLSGVYQSRYDNEKIKEAQIKLNSAENAMILEIKSNSDLYQLQLDLLSSSKSWRDEAFKAKNLADKNFRSGKIDSLQMQQVLNAFESAELAYIDAQLSFHLAQLRLDKSLGKNLAE